MLLQLLSQPYSHPLGLVKGAAWLCLCGSSFRLRSQAARQAVEVGVWLQMSRLVVLISMSCHWLGLAQVGVQARTRYIIKANSACALAECFVTSHLQCQNIGCRQFPESTARHILVLPVARRNRGAQHTV
jgi:hypothetical protein